MVKHYVPKKGIKWGKIRKKPTQKRELQPMANPIRVGLHIENITNQRTGFK